jgi:hypothetical protein
MIQPSWLSLYTSTLPTITARMLELYPVPDEYQAAVLALVYRNLKREARTAIKIGDLTGISDSRAIKIA